MLTGIFHKCLSKIVPIKKPEMSLSTECYKFVWTDINDIKSHIFILLYHVWIVLFALKKE